MSARSIRVAAAGELVASAVLVAVVFASGTIQVQLGAGTIGAALLGSIALGLGYAAVVWTFGRLSGAQTNPLISIIATVLGGQGWARTLLLVVAQTAGALVAALAIAPLADVSPASAAPLSADPAVADAVAAFIFVLVALGVAHRRTAMVPIALGCAVTATFWIAGRATAGNPLLSAALFLTGTSDLRTTITSVVAMATGATAAAGLALFLFPRGRDAAASLLWRPG